MQLTNTRGKNMDTPRTKHIVAASLAFLAVIGAPRADSETIAEYTFFPNTYAATTVTPNVTAGNLSWGAGVTGMHGISTGSGVGDNHSLYTRSTGISGAADDYVTFTLTTEERHELNLSEMSFYYAINTISASFTVRSSIDDFASNVAVFSPTNVNYTSTGSIDLGAAAYQKLTDIEFRIYLWAAVESNDYTLRMDRIQLLGNVIVIPEPGTLSLAGLAAAGLLLRRRRAGQPVCR